MSEVFFRRFEVISPALRIRKFRHLQSCNDGLAYSPPCQARLTSSGFWRKGEDGREDIPQPAPFTMLSSSPFHGNDELLQLFALPQFPRGKALCALPGICSGGSKSPHQLPAHGARSAGPLLGCSWALSLAIRYRGRDAA
jgi:hypothetical protein